MQKWLKVFYKKLPLNLLHHQLSVTSFFAHSIDPSTYASKGTLLQKSPTSLIYYICMYKIYMHISKKVD